MRQKGTLCNGKENRMLNGRTYSHLGQSLPEEGNTCSVADDDGPAEEADRGQIKESTMDGVTQKTIQKLSLVFLTLQQTVYPVMVRQAHKISRDRGQPPFLSSTVVLNTEVAKLLLSCTFLTISYGSFAKFCSEISAAFFKNKRETLKICVPALIYVIQNNLYFFALKRVEATLFSITYQLRILTTAILSILLLRRIFSRIQWGALCISLLGVCLVQLASTSSKGSGGMSSGAQKVADEQLLGLLTIIIMCWTSAFAGVYLEGVLKQSSCDIWTQNIRLSVITLPFAFLTVVNDSKNIQKNGFLAGWNWLLWIIVFSAAASGILVAVVMNIALGGTALLSIIIGDSQFSILLLVGVALVIASVFLYTLNPPSKIKSPTPELPTQDDNDVLEEQLMADQDSNDEEIGEGNENLELKLETKKRHGTEEIPATAANPSAASIAREVGVHLQRPSIHASHNVLDREPLVNARV